MIACANVANLLLARALGGEKDIAMRGALGASRHRLLRQLLTESTLLALAGGLIGAFWALWGVDLLVKLGPAEIPGLGNVGIDATALIFCTAISVLRGRTLTEQDVSDSPAVAVVNEAMVRRHFGGEDPFGQRITFGDGSDDNRWIEIVGVVEDVRHFRLDQVPLPEVYRPFRQDPWPFMSLVVRSGGYTEQMVSAIRNAVLDIDANQPAYGLATMEQVLSDTIASDRFLMLLLIIFAAMAGIPAAVGIYGVIFYSVGQRTREFGIRMALGAGRFEVLMMVIRQGMLPAVTGVAAGLLGALATGKLLTSLLFEISTTDPSSLALIASLVLLVSLLSIAIPSLRATRVDPAESLKYE